MSDDTTITIRVAGPDEGFPGSYVVERDGLITDGLGWDEMIGHVAALTFPHTRVRLNGPGLYRMLTPAQIAERNERYNRRRGEDEPEPAEDPSPADDVRRE